MAVWLRGHSQVSSRCPNTQPCIHHLLLMNYSHETEAYATKLHSHQTQALANDAIDVPSL